MKCSVCDRGKPASSFKYRKHTCNRCHKLSDSYRKGRDKYLVDTYGISLVEYETLLAYHDGNCWICGGKSGGKNLAVDHDHETGAVRGLLCKRCNTTIARYKDRAAVFTIMASYLVNGGDTVRRLL